VTVLGVGDIAPDFELPEQDGEQVLLSSFAGEWVVVYFYPKADTPGCTTEACAFRDRSAAFAERGATVLGVSTDPVEDLAAFAEKHSLPFTLLSDEDGEMAAAYDSFETREIRGEVYEIASRNSFLVDPDGYIAAVYQDVTPEGHAGEILADIPE